jgi:hypothetical protein
VHRYPRRAGLQVQALAIIVGFEKIDSVGGTRLADRHTTCVRVQPGLPLRGTPRQRDLQRCLSIQRDWVGTPAPARGSKITWDSKPVSAVTFLSAGHLSKPCEGAAVGSEIHALLTAEPQLLYGQMRNCRHAQTSPDTMKRSCLYRRTSGSTRGVATAVPGTAALGNVSFSRLELPPGCAYPCLTPGHSHLGSKLKLKTEKIR